MKYAKYISATQVKYPLPIEFVGVPNYLSNDRKLREKNYLPLMDIPPEQPNKTLVLMGFEIVPSSRLKTVTKYRTVDDIKDGEVVGQHQEPYTETVAQDTSTIRVTDYRYDDAQPEQEDTAERDEAERKIVRIIVGVAEKYNAVEELAAMEDITIPNLEALARLKSVTQEDWNSLITAITPLKWQLEAVEGKLWSECWQGLKSRFAVHLGELADA